MEEEGGHSKGGEKAASGGLGASGHQAGAAVEDHPSDGCGGHQEDRVGVQGFSTEVARDHHGGNQGEVHLDQWAVVQFQVRLQGPLE